MANVFDTPAMAAGYAMSRPEVHPHIIERARKHLPMPLPVAQALDVGCGAGLSTRALQSIARHVLGIDPSEAMVKCASGLVPGAEFRVGTAESLPVPSRSVDIITAAGSLNYADLRRFFPEAVRVLAPTGALVVYDFSPGRSFRHSSALDSWFAEFLNRYPVPPNSARVVSPETLRASDSGLQMSGHEHFEVGLALGSDFYLKYIMTETNVAYAIESGVPEEQIRGWCADTLHTVFQGSGHEVLFRGYLAVMLNEAA